MKVKSSTAASPHLFWTERNMTNLIWIIQIVFFCKVLVRFLSHHQHLWLNRTQHTNHACEDHCNGIIWKEHLTTQSKQYRLQEKIITECSSQPRAGITSSNIHFNFIEWSKAKPDILPQSTAQPRCSQETISQSSGHRGDLEWLQGLYRNEIEHIGTSCLT